MKDNSTAAGIFLNSVESDPDRLAIYFTRDDGTGISISNASLYHMICLACGGYKSRGLHRGDRVILAIPASEYFYAAYIGAWFYGIIPLVVSPLAPGRYSEREPGPVKMLMEKTGAALVVTPSGCSSQIDRKCPLVAQEEIVGDFLSPPDLPSPDAIAHLQSTSGSTASPRMVIVRHRNILANITGTGKAIKHRASDKLVSWLPLYHDMGLIGLCYSLGWSCPLISSTTSRFIRNPYTWLQMISDHGGTLSPAPNSAYLACVRLSKLRPPSGIDLSSWRVGFCGSEPVQESTVRGFSKAFQPFGYRPEVMLPVYGLAEATLAVTVPDPDTLPHVEYINAAMLIHEGRVSTDAPLSTYQRLGMVGLGSALSGHSIRIVDEEGKTLPEGWVGEVQVSGPSVTDGYWSEDSDISEIKSHDEFLRTGDLGFIWKGQLYISGRKKDIIIIGGRNFSPLFLENIAFSCLSNWIVRTIVAIGIPDSKAGTEQLHLLLDARPPDRSSDRPQIEDIIRVALIENAGIRGIAIHWVNRDQIPFTTSGKVQRYLCKQLIQTSQFVESSTSEKTA